MTKKNGIPPISAVTIFSDNSEPAHWNMENLAGSVVALEPTNTPPQDQKNTGEPSSATGGHPTHKNHKGSLLLAATSDTHVRTGQSDAGGDLLHLSGIYRKGSPRDNVLIAADAGLYSTPRSNPEGLPLSSLVSTIGAQHQRDTGVISVTVGREKPLNPHLDAGFYGTAGALNGVAYDAMAGFKDSLHSLAGMAPARRSPTSTGGEALAGVAGRLDSDVARIGHGKTQAQIVGTAGLNVGTNNREAMVAGHLWFGENTGNIFHPTLPGMPTPDNRGTGIYAGIRAEAVQYDAATNPQGTKPFRASVEAGAIVDLKKALLGIAVSKELNPSVQSQTVRATSTVRGTLTIPF